MTDAKSLDGLAGWQLIGFAAACAERVSPMLRRTARRRELELFEVGAGTAWAAAASDFEGAREDIRRLVRQLDAWSKELAGDSTLPEFYAGMVLAVVYYALLIAASAEPSREAVSASHITLDVTGECDTLNLGPNPPLVRAGNIPSPGPSTARELAAQTASIAELRAMAYRDTRTLEQMRFSQRTVSTEFDNDARKLLIARLGPYGSWNRATLP